MMSDIKRARFDSLLAKAVDKIKPVKNKKRPTCWAEALGVDPGPVPKGFLPELARRVLAGSMPSLNTAFFWRDSSQGAAYWLKQTKEEKLSPEAQYIIEQWIKEVEE